MDIQNVCTMAYSYLLFLRFLFWFSCGFFVSFISNQIRSTIVLNNYVKQQYIFRESKLSERMERWQSNVIIHLLTEYLSRVIVLLLIPFRILIGINRTDVRYALNLLAMVYVNSELNFSTLR